MSSPDAAFAAAAHAALAADGDPVDAWATVAGGAAADVLATLAADAGFREAWPSRTAGGAWGGVAATDLRADVADRAFTPAGHGGDGKNSDNGNDAEESVLSSAATVRSPVKCSSANIAVSHIVVLNAVLVAMLYGQH